MNYSFLKSFSQSCKVLTQRGDVINPELASKRAQTHISCTNGDKKMKIKSKRNSEVRYLFMKLFSQNLEILAPCCDVIISKLSQDSNLGLMTSQRRSKGWASIKILQFSKTNLENVLLSWNIVWLLILIFMSLLVHNVQTQLFFDPILR